MDSRVAIRWSLIGQLGFFALHLGSSMVLARLLSPAEFGFAMLLQSAVGVLQVFQNLGFGNYLIREKVLENSVASAVFWFNMIAAVVIGIIVLIFAPALAKFAELQKFQWVTYLLVASPLIIALEIVPAGLLARHLAYSKIAAVQWVRGLTTGGLTIVCALNGFSFASIVIGSIVGSFCALALTAWFARTYGWTPRLSEANFPPVIAFAKAMVPVSAASQLARRVPEVALGRLQGVAALGIYGRASGVLQMAWENVYAAIAQVMYAAISRAHRNGVSLKEEYRKILRLLTGTFWPVFLGLGLLASEVLELMFGKVWASAGDTLLVLCIGAVVQVGAALGWEIFLIHDRVKQQAKREVLRAILVAGFFFLGSMVSIEWAAASKIADGIFVILAYMPGAMQLTGLRKSDLSRIYVESAFLAVMAILPIVLIRFLAASGSSFSTWETLLLGSVGGALSWVIAIAVLQHPAWLEIRRVIVSLSRR
jgi:O-antigen/teichoic acid export membrane protein